MIVLNRMARVWARWLLLVGVLSLSQFSWAGALEDEGPNVLEMTTDLVVVRPALLAVTALGSVVWLVSLPFSAAGGNMMEAADTLVVSPAKATFVRCLGCTEEGYKSH